MHPFSAPEPPRRRAPTVVLGLGLLVSLIVNLLLAGNLGGLRSDRDELAARVDALEQELGYTTGPSPEEAIPVLSRQIEDLRELEFAEQVTPTFIGPDSLLGRLQTVLPAPRLLAGLPDPRALEAFGLVRSAEELDGFLEQVADEGIAGYYVPLTKTLVMRSDSDHLTPLDRFVLVHELTHALADQRIGLPPLLGQQGALPFAEPSLAAVSLVEGDATAVMNRWAEEHLREEERSQIRVDSGAYGAPTDGPPAIGRILGFPYADGTEFVEDLVAEGGWDAVDAAYRNPPVTTEQVLHAEKYRAGERGEITVIPGNAVPGGDRFADGPVGELFLRAILEPFVPETAAAAAAGWDGGAYGAYELPGGTGAALYLRWDAEADGAEFRTAWLQWARNRFGALDPAENDGAIERFDARDRCVSHVRVEPAVTLVTLLPGRCSEVRT